MASSSDEDDDIEQKKVDDRIAELSKRLSKNPHDYQAHVDLVDTLSSAGEFDRLTNAREAFARAYPLTARLWLAWASDERRMGADFDRVECIYKRAVVDYLSVDLWMEYCQFAMSGDVSTNAGIERVRDVCERAVAAAGIHAADGTLIWEAYRAFEQVLTSAKPANRERVDKLFRRQLAVPLVGMEKTYEEYAEWLRQGKDESMDENVIRLYKAGLAMLEKRMTFESKLADDNIASADRYACYNDYVALEMAEGNPARVINICERRITDHCLEPMAWIGYVAYVERTLTTTSDSVLDIYERAVRNCPWSSHLWIRYIRSLERRSALRTRIGTIIERALAACGTSNSFAEPHEYRDLWLAYIDYERRRLTFEESALEEEVACMRAVFSRALEHLASLGPGADDTCQLARYWASLEADRFRATDEARKIWAEVVRGAAGDCARMWLDFITLEKMFGDAKHLRKLFPRALDRTSDMPALIGEAWIQFEREEGTLSQFEEAEAKTAERLKRFADDVAAKKIAKRKGGSDSAGSTPSKKPKLSEDVVKQKNVQKTFNEPATSKEPEPSFKKPYSVKSPPGFKKDDNKPSVKPPPGFTKDKSDMPQTHADDEKTVFVSNLAFSVTDQDIMDMMKSSGDVVEVRLAKNHAGKSKGFGYVDFSTPSGARRALERDREALGGRPVFVSQCDSNKKARGEGHQFRYGTGLEKNKLFVRGFGPSLSSEDVNAMFSEHGKVADVRLVTYRNGHSKGIAYVEFANESDAARALVNMDGKMLDGGRQLSVAVSNPPSRPVAPDTSIPARSLGAATRGGRGSKVAFVPRSVVTKSSTNTSTNGNGTLAPKSNDEFRNLLTSKK